MWFKRLLVLVFAAFCAVAMTGCHAIFAAFIYGLTGEVPPGFSDSHEGDTCADGGECNIDIVLPATALVIPSAYTVSEGGQVTFTVISTPPPTGPVSWDTNGDGQIGTDGDVGVGNPVTVTFGTAGVRVVTASIPTDSGQILASSAISVAESGGTGPTAPGCTQLVVDLTRVPNSPDPPPPQNTVMFNVTQATRSGAPIEASYAWDFESDGTVDATTQAPGMMSHVYPAAGTYTATVTATAADAPGDCGQDSLAVNSAAPSGARSSAAGPPRFSLRLTGGSLDAGELTKGRKRVSLRDAIGLGDFRLRIAGSPPIVLAGTAISGSSLVFDREHDRRLLRGVMLAQVDDVTGATCLRYRLSAPSDEPLSGTIRILGGPADAGTRAGRGKVTGGSIKGKGGAESLRVRGMIRTKAAESRELPAPCVRLLERAL